MIKISVLLLVFLFECSWSRSVLDNRIARSILMNGGENCTKGYLQECTPNVDCCSHGLFCNKQYLDSDKYHCVESPPPSCQRQFGTCNVDGFYCCKDYKCIPYCQPESSICAVINGSRCVTDLVIRGLCPRKCGVCDWECSPVSPVTTCLNEFDTCGRNSSNQCCPGFTCIDYCKPEDAICPTKDASWCKYAHFRHQCPRKCGECAKCIKKRVEVV